MRTEVIRGSRSMSAVTASIIQPDVTGTPLERLRVTGTFADLGAAPPHVLTVARPPDLPARRVLHHRRPARLPLDESAVMQRCEMRIDPAPFGWFEGTPTGLGHMRAWFRMRDGRAPSTIMLLQVVDALPPVAHDLGVSGWVPTLELTVHVRAKPAPGWLRISTSSVNFASGFLEEDAKIWDCAARLAAQARQLAKVASTPSAPTSRGWVV